MKNMHQNNFFYFSKSFHFSSYV